MQSTCRCCDSSLVLCEYTLESVQVFVGGFSPVHDIVWQRSLTEREEVAFELIVWCIVEESQCASAACGIVDHLCHHRTALVEEELVAYSYLSCRLHEHVPQAHLLV